MLPPPNHPEVAKLRRSWVINKYRGVNSNRVRCQAAEIIHENQWSCSIDFVLGISAEVTEEVAKVVEIKNTSPPTQNVAEFNTITMPLVVKKTVQVPVVEKEQTSCKNCGNEIDWLNLKLRKTLHHNEQYCSPACKSKFYRKNSKKT